MLQSVSHIIRYNPRLKQINIRWAREKSPNHLKQEGMYDVTHDKDGNPAFVMVSERGIRLLGQSFYRQYKYVIKPEVKTSLPRPAKMLRRLHS